MVAIAEDENSIHNIVEKWSEWEIANSVIFSAISQWEQVHFQWDDDEVRLASDQHTSTLRQQSEDIHVVYHI